jgi:hypothetical protein
VRPRNLGVSLVIFALLAVGALVRIDRLSKQGAKRDERFLTLGQLARDLATEKQTFEVVLGKLGAGPNSFGLIGEGELAVMRKLFELGDYEGLDAQPQLTLDDLGGALGLLASHRGPVSFAPLAVPVHEPLGLPTGKPVPAGEPFLIELGLELKWGDRLDPEKASRGLDSARLAQVLEGLALGTLVLEGGAATPAELLTRLVKEGHTAVVVDQRLAANFGDLERRGKAIATPLWVGTGRKTATGEELRLPVPHAQLLLQVRGPTVNADVTLYPALDLTGDGGGGLRFRADLTKDQPWCGGRIAHRYENADALKAVEWMTVLRRGWEAKVRGKSLPLDGYFALGVCTLAPAVIEQALTGKTTLWPLTHDPALFDSDDALDRLVRALPHDGRGAAAADDARLSASIPWARVEEVPFEHLRAQLAELKLSP